ncbi:ATP-dependent RecD-like DNA helicase [Leptolyngbya sp. FACHB-16]|uniref:SF1B family DNA helicase RecD2 n=1 Tax=unclassified Leptolyngbya TaxID=2650499 RepID=UPI001685F8D0|nr:ATP-dependent RecD-like DNA helicase [Leptolyngbya sp. FACHB-16]MBD2157035.1 ATP-dependent RecD-like DNA helicase [Leptolyngbya sp. FACHB-16]
MQQPSANSSPPIEPLQGVVERITYHSEESGYTVARLKAPRTSELITIIGSFANVQAGQTLQLEGIWREHPKYGTQFQVTHYRETKPATLTGIEKYLGSGLIKGVGPVTAKRIVAHFKLDTLDIIENEIQRLIEVPGIAKKRVKMIQTAWETQKAIKEVMLFLQGHGVSTTYAVKIFKQYGNESIETVTQNPYRLATDVYGIGFVTADAIARNLGIHPNSEFRYRAGILHVLSEASEDGHCFLPQPELVQKTAARLALPDHRIEPDDILALTTDMAIDEELVMQGGPPQFQGQFLCYAPPFFHSEQGLANRVKRLLSNPVSVDVERVNRWIDRFTEKTGLQLSEQQRQAVVMAASHRVMILTGGPGVGKSFTCRTIVALWKAMGKAIALGSPTGRAAQRLSEMTGQEAKTIHRLLEFDPKHMKFKRDSENPIPADAIVIDEASMLDLFLANSLAKAVSPDAHLLLVGDTDQLPSVGPGAVLHDLIASGLIPVVRLTEVFRQAQASAIVSNAHRINSGEFPKLESVSNSPRTDCLWFNVAEPEQGVQAIRDLVTHLIPKLGFDPAQDVQVLCPMSRGDVGTRKLNQTLQELINPHHSGKAELVRGEMTLRVGDRILQLKNDYNREVFNGDLGVITAIDVEEQEVSAQFAGREVTYDYADLNEITLAFATTIHKSQGSEYPVVVLPVFMQHYVMLSRNLIYTGLTRARKLVVLVGDSKAIGLAIKQVKDQERYTLLDYRLSVEGAIA